MPGGITADTAANLVVGAGIINRAAAVFGASVDNNIFRIDREIFTPELNGLKGALLGTDYITKSEGVLETTIPEVSEDVLAAGWAGSRSNTVGDVTTIDEDETRRIPLTDYASWELEVERLAGGTFKFQVDNAINRATIQGELQDDGLFAPRYELHAAWAYPATSSPHRILIEELAS